VAVDTRVTGVLEKGLRQERCLFPQVPPAFQGRPGVPAWAANGLTRRKETGRVLLV
jgi:hypothetical protein